MGGCLDHGIPLAELTAGFGSCREEVYNMNEEDKGFTLDELTEMREFLEAPQEPAARKKQKVPKEPRGMGYELYLLLHDLVYILAAVTIVFVVAIRLVGVDGDSMYPTLHQADYLGLLSNVLYQDVEPGDIVVMTVP